MVPEKKERKHYPTTKVLSYRQYLTFQGFYRVKATDTSELSVDDIFSKCVLQITTWLKDRADEKDLKSELAFLTFYPRVEEFKTFKELLYREDDTLFQRAKGNYDINIFASKNENTWTLRITEPDNGKETSDFPGRVFITNVSIKQCQDNVLVAMQTRCKEPSNNVSEAAAFRPACLYYIYEDEDLVMNEAVISSDEYMINGSPLYLNTGSKECCQQLYDDLMTSDARQMPIVFCPSLDEEDYEETIARIANGFAGLAYVFVEQNIKNYTKLFFSVMDNDIEHAEMVKTSFLVMLPVNCDDEQKWQVFDVDKEGRKLLRECIGKYTVRRDGVNKSPKYCFGDVLFYTELRDKYVLDMQDAADVELLEDMRTRLEQMAKNAELLPEEDRKQYDETMSALQGTINELKEKIELMKKQNRDYSQMIAEKSSENARLRNKLKAFEQDEEEPELEEEITVNDNFDVREQNADKRWKEEFPQKVSMVVPWLREKYEDTVYIHDDAERAFDKIAKSDLNIKRFCEAFAFLDAYTRFRSGKLSPEFYEAIERRTSFRAMPTGFEGTQKDAPAYFVDMDLDNVNKRGLLCDLHLKYSANSNETFRIYFTYIEELGKVVVGSMPDHLSLGVNDNRNRKNKV